MLLGGTKVRKIDSTTANLLSPLIAMVWRVGTGARQLEIRKKGGLARGSETITPVARPPRSTMLLGWLRSDMCLHPRKMEDLACALKQFTRDNIDNLELKQLSARE